MARNGVIGRDNALPWRLPADLARFKQLTMGHHLIMGRKTWESIGRVLPGRTMVVLSSRPDFAVPGVLHARSIEQALALCGEDEVFVAGGAEVFRQLLPRATRLCMTLVDADIPGDIRFPEFDESTWSLTSREPHLPDERNPYPYTFLTYERAAPDHP